MIGTDTARDFVAAAERASEAIQSCLLGFARLATEAVLGPSPASYSRMFAETAGQAMIDGFLAGLNAPPVRFSSRFRHFYATGRLRPPRRAARRRHNRKLKHQ